MQPKGLSSQLILGFVLLSVVGCAQFGSKPGIERADDLGLETVPTDVQQLPSLPSLPPLSTPDANSRSYRDGFVEQWMARSDLLCRRYKDKIILLSRNSRFATDATSTILSGLATIFTAVGTIHPLTGAATIVSGVGAASQTDTFEQQSGEIIASAIQTARENQANQIEGNLRNLGTDEYSIYRAERDVIDYHNMCSLETALAQVRSSLKATSPNQGNLPPATQGGLTAVAPSPPPPPASSEQSPPPPHPASGPPIPLRPPTVGIVGAVSPAERNMTAEEGRQVQAALCLSPDPGTVSFGPQTRGAIDMFRTTGGHQGPTGGLTTLEANFLKRTPPCAKAQFANIFEYLTYRSDSLGTSTDKIKHLQAELRAKGKNVPDSGQFDPTTRAAIGELQEANGMTKTNQVTRDFLRILLNIHSPQ